MYMCTYVYIYINTSMMRDESVYLCISLFPFVTFGESVLRNCFLNLHFRVEFSRVLLESLRVLRAFLDSSMSHGAVLLWRVRLFPMESPPFALESPPLRAKADSPRRTPGPNQQKPAKRETFQQKIQKLFKNFQKSGTFQAIKAIKNLKPGTF